MGISLNHTIVVARDKEKTATFLTEMLGLPPHMRLGHFAVVRVSETSLDFVETDAPIEPRHFAFLVSEGEFDEILQRIRDRQLPYWADPFRYPTVADVIETLNQGRPANAADLQALVNAHLHAISAEFRDGPTDGWKGMWNVDGYGRPTQPRPENDCRDRLLDLLRLRLLPVGVAPEPEGQYAEDKRADIKAIIGSINLPVEIKRHFHPDIWTAPRDQLKKLYARDPGTAGRGIYLVFWFGIGAGSVPTRPTGGAEIQTPVQLKAALLDTLEVSEKELLEIIVIDCAPPQTLSISNGISAEPAGRKLRKRKGP